MKSKIYKELLELISDNQVVDSMLVSDIKSLLQQSEVEELFNIPLSFAGHKHYLVVNSYDSWTSISYFGKETDRSIGCSDDGKQPDEEWLYVIRFTCGAYLHGDDYPKSSFDAMFEELKSFGCKYSDTVNNVLYFSPKNAKLVYDAFWEVFNKHKDRARGEVLMKRKIALEKQLQELEKEMK